MHKPVLTPEMQNILVGEARCKGVAMLQSTLEGQHDVARRVEKAVWNHAIDVSEQRKVKRIWFEPAFRILYTAKIRSLVFNLSHPDNPDLKRHVLSALMTPDELVIKPPEDLFPTGPYNAMAVQLSQKATAKENEYADGFTQCGRCKSWKVQWTQVQTRSADEPMTVFFWCSKCSARWRSS